MGIINVIIGRKPRKQVLVMDSPNWKKWVADMHEQLPSDIAVKAIAITAKYQKFQEAA